MTRLTQWWQFFLIKLPAAVIATGVVVEVVAFALTGVVPHRHNVDDLANAVVRGTKDYPIVIIGDSVAHNVTHKFRIGEAGQVADLTTHAAAGIPSNYLLLKRYLESGRRPKDVVMLFSRNVFIQPLYKGTFSYYLQSVFRNADEKSFLKEQYPTYVDYAWRPAALDIMPSVAEPVLSLLRHPSNEIWQSPELPRKEIALDEFPDGKIDPLVMQSAVNLDVKLLPAPSLILQDIGRLSLQYGFRLHYIFPPMQVDLYNALVQNGKMKQFDDQIINAINGVGANMSFDDANRSQRYKYFDREAIHLRGQGWENRFALQLNEYIASYK